MISIIVPIYNVEKELTRCVDSIIDQTYKDIEIILVNDGSTDGSLDICKNYEHQDDRIVIINKDNGGLSDARNYGIEAATGEYVLLVDSDDYIEKDACEMLLKGMKSDDVDFVVGALREVRNSGEIFQRHSNIENNKIYESRDFIIKSIKNNEWYAPAVLNLYRKDFLEKNRLQYKVGRYYEDMEMLPRLYLSADKICYIDYCFYNYVIREGSITASKSTKKKLDDVVTTYAEWKMIYDNLEDKELQKYLYGNLLKCYLKSCRVHKIKKWIIQGVDFRFAIKYSLNVKEKMKAIFFNIIPKIYVEFGD